MKYSANDLFQIKDVQKENLITETDKLYRNEVRPDLKEIVTSHQITEPFWYTREASDFTFIGPISYVLGDIADSDCAGEIAAINQLTYTTFVIEDDLADDEQRRWNQPPAYKKFGTDSVVRFLAHSQFDTFSALTELDVDRDVVENYVRNFGSIFRATEKLEAMDDIEAIESIYRLSGTKCHFYHWIVETLYSGDERDVMLEFLNEVALVQQLFNDYMDIQMTNEMERGNDLSEGRVNVAVSLLYEQLDESAQDELRRLYCCDAPDERRSFVLTKIEDCDFQSICRDILEEHTYEGIRRVDTIVEGKYRQILEQYARFWEGQL